MKRHLLWTFDRGSFQWDILCVLILAFLFLIPSHFFNDVPDFMKLCATETICKTVDRNGTMIFTVNLDEPCVFDTDNTRKKAQAKIEKFLDEPITRSRTSPRTQPIRDWTGRLVAYAIWKEN